MANKNKLNKNSANGTNGTTVDRHQQKEHDRKDYSSLKIVMFYCSLIVFLPIVTFFSMKAMVLDTFFSLTEVKTNIYSAVSAVAALHLALGLYIYRAYFGVSSESGKKAD